MPLAPNPFQFRTVDTVLPDRAIACYDSDRSDCMLVNGDGQVVTIGSSKNYRLVNKKKRIFAFTSYTHNDMLANDNGGALTGYSFDAESTEDNFVRTAAYDGHRYWYGLLTPTGDSVLPDAFSSVTMGEHLYAGVRGDTAFVYQQGKGLLFSISKVHDCHILHNDFITVKKYGGWALVSRRGKLLTDFKYFGVEDLRYPSSRMPQDNTGSRWPPVVPQYAMTSCGQEKGLVDGSGHELLPAEYDVITMNTNGWFILRKVMHHNEALTDKQFKPILESGEYQISFISDRYVTVTARDPYSDNEKVRTYDMLARKYVPTKDGRLVPLVAAKPAQVVKKKAHHASTVPEKQYGKDTIVLNAAQTMLIRNGGRWGVISITGDTIVPFVYDSANAYQYHKYFVRRNGQYAVLNAEGDLATPDLPALPGYITADSQAVMRNKDVYSYKGRRVRKIDTEKEPMKEWTMQFQRGGLAYQHPGTGNIMKPGIYNRKLERIADRPADSDYNGDIRQTGIVAVKDSAGKMIAVIDSTGKQLIPWMKEPKRLLMYDYCAIVVDDTGLADVLFRFEDNTVRTDTVYLEPARKRAMLNPFRDQYGRVTNDYFGDDRTPFPFTSEGGEKGFIYGQSGKAILVKRGRGYAFRERYCVPENERQMGHLRS